MDPAATSIFEPGVNLFIWVSIAALVVAAVADYRGHRTLAVPVASAGWVVFGIFWGTMLPYFIGIGSPVQTILALAGIVLSVYTGYLLYTGRDSLLLLSRAVGLMGLVYLPAATIAPIRNWLIELVAVQALWGIELFGYEPQLTTAGTSAGIDYGATRNVFDWEHITGDSYSVYIVFACTGLGAISVFTGLIASISAPLRRKAVAIAAAVGIIWVLNLVRNVLVVLASQLQWFDTPFLTATIGPHIGSMRLSYFISHTLLAQPLAVVVLIGLTYFVLRLVPEVATVLEEVLFVLTGSEYDLDTVVEQPTYADGLRSD